MNLYILDWSGTLDRQANPKGLVRALQSLGHKVVVWSGHTYIPDPAAAAADRVESKNSLLREVIDHGLKTWPETLKVIVSDDDEYVADLILNILTDPAWASAIPIEFLQPRDLNKHLTSFFEKAKPST